VSTGIAEYPPLPTVVIATAERWAALRTALQAGSVGPGQTIVTWDTFTGDAAGLVNSSGLVSGSGTLTAEVGGLFVVAAQVAIEAVAGVVSDPQIQIRRNGTVAAEHRVAGTTLGIFPGLLALSTLMQLAVGDSFDVRFGHLTGAGTDQLAAAGATAASWIRVARVSQ